MPGSSFGSLLKKKREDKHKTQKELAKEIGFSPKWISALETGEKSASYKNVLHLIQYFGDEDNSTIWFLELLKSELAKYRDELLKNHNPLSSSSKEERLYQEQHIQLTEEALAKLEKLARDLSRTPTLETQPNEPRTLQHFSELQPMTVAVGDRSDLTSNTTLITEATFHSLPSSATDLYYLEALGLSTETRLLSHKIFFAMTDDYLKAHYGNTNLLAIGSSLVNGVTRRANDYGLFRFNLHPVLEQKFESVRAQLREINLGAYLEILYAMVSLPLDSSPKAQDFEGLLNFYITELAKKIDPWVSQHLEHYAQRGIAENVLTNLAATAKTMIPLSKADELFHYGLLEEITDPFIEGGKHVFSGFKNQDLGLISVTPNPWSDSHEYVSVVCAGLSAAGTAKGLYLLSRPEEFKSRPFGGVYEVIQSSNLDLPARIPEAIVRWITPAYKVKDYLNRLIVMQKSAEGERKEQLEKMTRYVGQLVK
jgi:transcriptional regulator with XRE-family HTH domain